MAHMLRKHHQTDSTKQISTIPIHRDSRVISKVQPKIRIIHIFAPEIIQTDVANFRELVQRLTGKPSSSSDTTTTTTTTTATGTTTSTSSGSSLEKNTSITKARKLDVRPQVVEGQYPMMAAYNDYHNYKPVVSKREGFGGYYGQTHEGYGDDNGGFLEVFNGVDCFMQEMGADFSMESNHQHQQQQQQQHLDHHQFGDAFNSLSY